MIAIKLDIDYIGTCITAASRRGQLPDRRVRAASGAQTNTTINFSFYVVTLNEYRRFNQKQFVHGNCPETTGKGNFAFSLTIC